MTHAEKLADLTLEEKAALTSGLDFWHTVEIPRLGIPSALMTDGPHGLRKQLGGLMSPGNSEPATCFPPAVGLGSTWDPALARRVGEAIATEALSQDIGVVLGPGINIKRSPLGGRNFEYFSEDPLISGVLGSALVEGMQGKGIGASVKHFAANNQETDRMRSSSDVDPRTLREIYLRAFGRIVAEQQPWTVMCSYNRINGVYASENRWLLTEVLRDEWGFEGLVVSDWGAVSDATKAIPAGLDLEMPSSFGRSPARLVAAVKAGEVDEADLDAAARRVLQLVDRIEANKRSGVDPEHEAHHALAREVAGRAIVLLQNNDQLLPLDASAGQRLAVIGEFARTPRYQGAGSSLINPTRLDNALDAISAEVGPDAVTFAPGFTIAGQDTPDAQLEAEAVEAARSADVAIIFAGLPDIQESEGFDRTDIELPEAQQQLIAKVAEANPRTVVVLSNGGLLRVTDIAAQVPALLEGWLLGQAGGPATADVLFGRVNPSGKLTETLPVRLADNPSYLNFPGAQGHTIYGEGLFVGYRWYDAKDLEVSFPFGHGLSYTTFSIDGATAAAHEGGVRVTARVRNTGNRDGREVVQVYASLPGSSVIRPPRQLVGFVPVDVAAGSEETAVIEIPRHELAYFDADLECWLVEGGEYVFEVGASSRDLPTKATAVVARDEARRPLRTDSTLAEWWADPKGNEVFNREIGRSGRLEKHMEDQSMRVFLEAMPLDRAIVMFQAPVEASDLVAQANADD